MCSADVRVQPGLHAGQSCPRFGVHAELQRRHRVEMTGDLRWLAQEHIRERGALDLAHDDAPALADLLHRDHPRRGQAARLDDGQVGRLAKCRGLRHASLVEFQHVLAGLEDLGFLARTE
jgi:hypothetical protein